MLLTPFAIAVLCGIVLLIIRRGILRPVGLGTHVSAESILIGLFITTLMVTFLLTWRIDEASTAGRINWWGPLDCHPRLPGTHSRVEAPAPGAVADYRVPEVEGTGEPAETSISRRAGWPRNGEGPRKQERARRVHVRRAWTLPGECPAWGAGKPLNPKAIILQTQDALLTKPGDTKLVDLTGRIALAVHDVQACENQCVRSASSICRF
ncbi:MAG: hypothetical protein U0Q11_02865 [Vicinamibacterales bacterium]